jgi:DNA-binding LytR/AlgR family response regulator
MIVPISRPSVMLKGNVNDLISTLSFGHNPPFKYPPLIMKSVLKLNNLLSLLRFFFTTHSHNAAYPQRLLVPDGNRMTFIAVSDIHYIEAVENYISIKTSDQSYMLLKTMNEIEGQLDPAHFFRIHRSYLVNVNEVSSIEFWGKRQLSD